MQNAEVARFFDELADLLEIDGANPFRVRAYRNAARTVTDLAESISALAEQGAAALTRLPGIGDDLAKKIVTIVETGSLPQLEELRMKVPAGVVEMLRIPGLGPKKAAALFKELQIQSLDQLKEAAEKGEVARLKGFGAKTAQSILEGLAQIEQFGRRFLIDVARAEAEEIVSDLLRVKSVKQASAAGSCRRRRETCGDLDVPRRWTHWPLTGWWTRCSRAARRSSGCGSSRGWNWTCESSRTSPTARRCSTSRDRRSITS
jgi:DNA polymerase (family 10)